MAALPEAIQSGLEPQADVRVCTPAERLESIISGNWTQDTLEWLRDGFSAYVMGQGDLETCLGLNAPCPGRPPRRKQLNREIRNQLVRALSCGMTKVRLSFADQSVMLDPGASNIGAGKP